MAIETNEKAFRRFAGKPAKLMGSWSCCRKLNGSRTGDPNRPHVQHLGRRPQTRFSTETASGSVALLAGRVGCLKERRFSV